MLLGDNNGVQKNSRGKPVMVDHKPLETYLGRYGGLMLYLKEMDETTYGKLCAVGQLLASAHHSINAFDRPTSLLQVVYIALKSKPSSPRVPT